MKGQRGTGTHSHLPTIVMGLPGTDSTLHKHVSRPKSFPDLFSSHIPPPPVTFGQKNMATEMFTTRFKTYYTECRWYSRRHSRRRIGRELGL